MAPCLSTDFDCNHLSVFNYIEHFRTENFKMEIERYLAGVHHPEASKKKYVKLDNRIRAIVNSFANVVRLLFVWSIALNLDI